ncbi:hypothetical protein JCM8547_003971 [Rhodosporidiobolus lusitaniae]
MSEGLSPAAKRAAERQARLLAKGQDRLNKITGAAKGEGRFVNETGASIPPRPPAVTNNPPAPSSLADVNNDDDPAEIDLASAANPLSLLAGAGGPTGAAGANPFAAFMAGQGGEGGGAMPGGDMLSQMMAQMAAAQGGAGGADGKGTAPGAGGLGAFGPGGAGGAGGNPFMAPPPPPRTFLDRVFPLVHILAMVGLAVYAVAILEPARRVAEYGWTGTESGIDWNAWGALLVNRPREYGAVAEAAGFRQLAEVPLLWMFVSVELVLQTTRLFLIRNNSSPPGLLSSILPLLSQFSPQLGYILQTGVRYLDLLTTCLNDFAVLVFCIGVVVLVGRWKAGPPGFVEMVEGKANEMLEKAVGEL